VLGARRWGGQRSDGGRGLAKQAEIGGRGRVAVRPPPFPSPFLSIRTLGFRGTDGAGRECSSSESTRRPARRKTTHCTAGCTALHYCTAERVSVERIFRSARQASGIRESTAPGCRLNPNPTRPTTRPRAHPPTTPSTPADSQTSCSHGLFRDPSTQPVSPSARSPRSQRPQPTCVSGGLSLVHTDGGYWREYIRTADVRVLAIILAATPPRYLRLAHWCPPLPRCLGAAIGMSSRAGGCFCLQSFDGQVVSCARSGGVLCCVVLCCAVLCAVWWVSEWRARAECRGMLGCVGCQWTEDGPANRTATRCRAATPVLAS